MKKAVLKGAVFGLIFFIALFVISGIMNKGNNDMTVEMSPATFPVVYMGLDGMQYNELHGYSLNMNPAYLRDTITALGEGRNTEFTVNKHGEAITGVSYEVRSVDGQRLIENTTVTEYEEDEDTIKGQIVLKDLIAVGTEYSLIILLDTEENVGIRYYTRVIWSPEYNAVEKINFVKDFTELTFDKEGARELVKYLESNADGDNTTFHKVNIHSSFNQITWGDLGAELVTQPVINLVELASQTASFRTWYIVSTKEGKDTDYYYVEEYYRIRYSTDRIYLLNYDRTMNSFFENTDRNYINDKIMLGITGSDLEFIESDDGNIFVFEIQNLLCSYNVTTNKFAVLFGFYDDENADERTIYGQHGIKILDVDEAGNVQFAVYGYMNRGRHEGEVGIRLYLFNSTLNTVEEKIYIPYDKPFQILAQEIEQLLYVNRDNFLYMTLDESVYEVNIADKTYKTIVHTTQDGSLQVSDSHKMIVWQDGTDTYHCGKLVLMNLNSRRQIPVEATSGESIMPLGFMGEDLIYGIARQEDIVTDSAGRTTFPMYEVFIQNANGEILKNHSEEGFYVTGCVIEENQINLQRVSKTETGGYEEAATAQITNNKAEAESNNRVITALSDRYEKLVQIQVKKNIDSKALKIVTPQEVLFEGGRELRLEAGEKENRYYVYGPKGVQGIYRNAASAVNLAYDISGVVMNDTGNYVWIKGNRVTRNQIMAITGVAVTEEKNSVAICLDTILKYEGIIRNSEYLLAQGETIFSVLEKNLENAQILDLKGCNLDSILYYVNRDIPVFASLNDGNAVLIVGFNEFNIVVMDPLTGKLEKRGMNDSQEWLEENGNCFITYIYK